MFRTVLILEDDVYQGIDIEEKLKKKYPNWKYLRATSYDEAVKFFNETIIHLFILDIDLGTGDKDGIAFGNYVRSHRGYEYTIIIYLTGLYEKVHKALQKTHCSSFLVKPASEEVFYEEIDFLLKSPVMQEKSITLPLSSGIKMRVKPSKIKYINTIGKNLIVTMIEDSEVKKENLIEVYRMSLKEILKQLPSNFIQVHRCYAINLELVERYDSVKRKLLFSKKWIPVGKRYLEDLILKL